MEAGSGWVAEREYSVDCTDAKQQKLGANISDVNDLAPERLLRRTNKEKTKKKNTFYIIYIYIHTIFTI